MQRPHAHEEGEQRRPFQRAVQDLESADDHDDDDAEPGDRLEHDASQRLGAHHLDQLVEVGVSLGEGRPRLLLLAAVRLDDADAAHELQDDVEQDVARAAQRVRALEGAPRDEDDREDGEREGGQRPDA